MPRAKRDENQYSIKDYQLRQVDVRLKLSEGAAYYSQTPLSNPSDAVAVMRDVLKELDREWVCVVNMDNHLKPINFNVVSIGSINSSVAPIQNIFKSAILSNSNNLILLHSHPSGDVTPSQEDITLTKRLSEASKLMELNLLDHVIVGGGNGRLYSFREEMPDMFRQGDDIDLDYIHAMERNSDPSFAENRTSYKTRGYDPKEAAEKRKAEMKQITEKLEKGVEELFASDKYQKFLDTMAKFPRYSINNNLLILMQKPDATLVQSYTGWKQMGRYVKKGEKGIRILAPTPFKIDREQNKLDEKGQTILDKDGEPVKETVQISMTGFKPVSTFDLSQTEGEPIPSLGVSELTGSVEGYASLIDAIQKASPAPIEFKDTGSAAKGYFVPAENKIVVQKEMSEIQTVKTLIHEIAHAKLHNMDVQKAREDGEQTRSSKEVEAESVAYTVCQHFGIDTSDYSFGYVAGWSEGKELKELKASLDTIQTAASDLITSIEDNAKELVTEKDQTQEKTNEPEKAENKDKDKEPEKKPSVREKLKEEKAAEKPRATKSTKTKTKEESR